MAAYPLTVRGFTLVEVLVAFAVLMILMVILANMVNLTSSTWSRTKGSVEQFQQARAAFEVVTRRLSEAVLNTYLDYVDGSGNPRTVANSRTFLPARYVRRSELRFLSGPGITGNSDHTTHAIFFQAPQGVADANDAQGLGQLLNSCGFFIELDSDEELIPSILPRSFAKERFRLKQLIEPSEKMGTYKLGAANPDFESEEWFTKALEDPDSLSIVGENIIALILLPKLSAADQAAGGYQDNALAPNYTYDSTEKNNTPALNPSHQLPPVVQVTMVAIDEASAMRLESDGQAALKTLLDGLFKQVGSTTDASQTGFARDLETLESFLNERRLNYRIFTSNVSLKAAKWSRDQKN
jgi:uncharacterized protein (TIGR02599 family)